MEKIITKNGKERIDSICRQYNIRNYSINPDGSIDVVGNIDLSNKKINNLPLIFNNVSGDFSCQHNGLTSLEGSPTLIGGFFNCQYNRLANLIGAPTTIGKYFNCQCNVLTSLVGSPRTVGGYFGCDYNKLTSLVGIPETVSGSFWATRNAITSTYSGDVDIEVGEGCYLNHNKLPQSLQDYMDQHKAGDLILKYQRYFGIWDDDLTLNVENYNGLMTEIKDGLG